MPGWAKTLLGILCVVAVLVIGALVLGIVYVVRNKDAWRAKNREVVAEGNSFGNGTDTQGCVDESMVRYKKQPGILNANSINLFVRGCLESSRLTPGFCDKIPVGKGMELMEWRKEQCRHYELGGDPGCNFSLFIPVVMFCGEQKRKGS
jgi:hypothetical protein